MTLPRALSFCGGGQTDHAFEVGVEVLSSAVWSVYGAGRTFLGLSPAVTDGLGEEAQVLVDL